MKTKRPLQSQPFPAVLLDTPQASCYDLDTKYRGSWPAQGAIFSTASLEVDQPQKNSCHKTVSTCLAVCSRSRSADLDQLRGGKLSALNTHVQILSNEGPAM